MTSTRNHTCVFFDDGELEHLICACGRRALRLLDEDGQAGVLVALLEDDVIALTRRTDPLADLAASA